MRNRLTPTHSVFLKQPDKQKSLKVSVKLLRRYSLLVGFRQKVNDHIPRPIRSADFDFKLWFILATEVDPYTRATRRLAVVPFAS